jgi:exodeoxyribonuclease VIII
MVREQTAAMQLGSLVHAMVLEPETVCENYIVAPKVDRRTNVGKASWLEFLNTSSGKEVVEADTMELAKFICDAVRSNKFACELLDVFGYIEKPVFWTCPNTGLGCRSKPDFDAPLPGAEYILDLKSCQDATPSGFAKSAASFGYGRQAAWYQWGHENAKGYKPAFVFVAVSSSPPFEVGIYELNENDLHRCRMQNEIDLAELAECMKTDNWAARHERNIVKLSLPKWTEFEDEYQSY